MPPLATSKNTASVNYYFWLFLTVIQVLWVVTYVHYRHLLPLAVMFANYLGHFLTLYVTVESFSTSWLSMTLVSVTPNTTQLLISWVKVDLGTYSQFMPSSCLKMLCRSVTLLPPASPWHSRQLLWALPASLCHSCQLLWLLPASLFHSCKLLWILPTSLCHSCQLLWILPISLCHSCKLLCILPASLCHRCNYSGYSLSLCVTVVSYSGYSLPLCATALNYSGYSLPLCVTVVSYSGYSLPLCVIAR